jgi:4-hydroxy-tetrahydrodipicolinate reductase
MRLLIIGNGRMGNEIRSLAENLGHEIVFTIDNEVDWKSFSESGIIPDAAIEFTIPNVAVDNIIRCFKNSIPVVCGTTAWWNRLPEVHSAVNEFNGSLIYASNFSPGMNVAFEINQRLAKIMNNFANYQVHINETHHIHKLDSPSGTAVSLANDITEIITRKKSWVNNEPANDEQILINSFRLGEVTGNHDVVYESDADIITLSHHAKNRKGFALGAIIAANWIIDKKGIFTMKDLITQLSSE